MEWCFLDLLEDIEKTRPRYPEELEAEASGSNLKSQKANGNGHLKEENGNGKAVEGELVSI